MTYKKYRCCFTDGGDRILRTEAIDSIDDASAVLQVERLLTATAHPIAELWDGHRLVGRWSAAICTARLHLSAMPAE